MASVFPKTLISKSGKTTIKWYVGYYQDGKHRSKSAGDSKTVALKLKKRIEAELETGKYDFLSQPTVVRIDHSIAQYLDQTQRLRKSRSYVRYKNALSHLLRFLEDRHPHLIVVSKLNQGHSPSIRHGADPRRSLPTAETGSPRNPRDSRQSTLSCQSSARG